MDSLLDYLDMLEDLLERSKAVPFSNRISIDKERVFDLVSEMRLNLPNEMRQAQRIIEDHDKIIADAKNKAASIIKEAEHKAQELTDEHEIYKLAVEQSRELMEDTKRSARDMRLSAVDYADEILSKTENAIRDCLSNITAQYRVVEDNLSDTIEVLYSNRQELRGNK